jgi:hypothetical protein
MLTTSYPSNAKIENELSYMASWQVQENFNFLGSILYVQHQFIVLQDIIMTYFMS